MKKIIEGKERGIKMNLTSNLKNLIEIYGVDGAMQAIDVMLTQEIESIEELNDCIAEEISYAAESN